MSRFFFHEMVHHHRQEIEKTSPSMPWALFIAFAQQKCLMRFFSPSVFRFGAKAPKMHSFESDHKKSKTTAGTYSTWCILLLFLKSFA